MGMLDFWKTAEQKANENPAPAQQQQPAQQNTNVSTPNGATAATPEARQAAGGSEQLGIGTQNAKDNPAAAPFGNLWELSEEEKKRAEQPQFVPFGADVTPEKIMEAARQVNFTSQISPEVMQKITSGDQQALIDLVNSVGQSAYAQSAMTSVNAARQVAEKQNAFMMQQLPDMVRKLQQRNDVGEENPLASNPQTKPMFDMMFNQFQTKYPNATTKQLQEYTTSYLQQFITTAGGTLPETKTAPAAETTAANRNTIKGDDAWNSFFE